MNTGIYYAELNEVSKAMQMYETSMEIHKQNDNKLGEIKTMGNMGSIQLY